MVATDDTEAAAEPEQPPVTAVGPDLPPSGRGRGRALGIVLLAVGLVAVIALAATLLLRSRAAPAPSQTSTAAAQTAPAPVAAAGQAAPTAEAAMTPAATLQTVPTPAGPPGTIETPTPDPTGTATVSAAYDRYWQVRSQALLNLDASQLSSVMDGNELDATSTLISNLQTEGEAIYTDVQHSYQIAQVSPVAANVDDHYVDNSYYVRPGTTDRIQGAASPPGAGENVATLFVMAETDGVWKVVESVTEQ